MIDPASIEVSRRGRQVKTDRLDVERLLALLLRYVHGETTALRVVRVPSEEAEHRRQLHREFITTTQDRVRVRNRMKGLLATQGLHVPVQSDFATRLPGLRRWDDQPLPAAITRRLEGEWAKVELLTTHIKGLDTERHQAIQTAADPMAAQVRQLVALRGIGEHSAWVFVAEHFAWRQLRNRRQVGALAGLVPLPHKSGTLDFDRGISKAGSRRVRSLAVQIAWMWVRYQPQSALTQWWEARFASGGPRARQIGIVAWRADCSSSRGGICNTASFRLERLSWRIGASRTAYGDRDIDIAGGRGRRPIGTELGRAARRVTRGGFP